MATKFSPRRSLSRYMLMLVSLLTLVGVLGGCGASSVAGPSHPGGSTPTSTPTRSLKGTIREIPLPANFYLRSITTGPDGNLWIAGNPIGRITPIGVIREFSLPANSFALRITTGPDGNLWFIEADRVGRITPAGKISEFPLPSSILAPTHVGHMPFVATSRRGRIMPSGLPNLVPLFRTARSGASPPQVRSAHSPCPILNLTRPVSQPGPTATSGLSALLGTMIQRA
jgi:hypothetical protein